MPTILAVDASGRFAHFAHPLRTAGFSVRFVDAIGADSFPVSDLPTAVIVRFQNETDFARETCLEIRRAAPEIPLIVISPITDVATKVCLLDLGADDYLEEPFAEEELIARLRSVIRLRQSRVKSARV